MSNSKTKKLVGVAMLASLAWVISMLAFPVLPGSPFLKVDFSDLAVLFGMYVYGPAAGITIAFIRSLLSYAQKGGEMGFPIGDTAAFIASVSFTLPIYLVLIKHGSSLKNKIAGIFSSTLSLTVMMSVLNWLFIAPAYMAVMGFDVGPMRTYLLLAVVPFNLIKGVLVGLVFYVAFSKLKPWLDKTKKKYEKKRAHRMVANETH
ncbi:Riboflavin transporter FmnP [Alkalibacterium putridalgicola]|uniref:Riboflavin transporter n=1 Tax=Alkalibacterium putridalgicola TaxID=426703 RepID=A0A1H7Q0N3_9LACT|nr:riboflavin transporter [Alkalibacterium putridalgicola]SEL41359.1 Riboflavin transporter FmnP [Alkalibacterium putridalgicola]